MFSSNEFSRTAIYKSRKRIQYSNKSGNNTNNNVLAFFREFFSGGGAKSIAMQISVDVLTFLLFPDKILGGQTA